MKPSWNFQMHLPRDPCMKENISSRAQQHTRCVWVKPETQHLGSYIWNCSLMNRFCLRSSHVYLIFVLLKYSRTHASGSPFCLMIVPWPGGQYKTFYMLFSLCYLSMSLHGNHSPGYSWGFTHAALRANCFHVCRCPTCLSVFVIVCQCLSGFVRVCQCLSLFVIVCQGFIFFYI